VEGYSSFGNYVGNNSADGPFLYTGFKPAFLMIKSTGVQDWRIYDNVRSPYNVMANRLWPNLTNVEGTSADGVLDFLSNGFKFRDNSAGTNNGGSSVTYLYMAFAENPFGGSGVAQAKAR